MRRPLSLILAMSMAGSAYSECYSRIAMNNKTQDNMLTITDVQRTVVPVSQTQAKCVVNYRAQIDGTWHTVEGEAVGLKSTNSDSICAEAVSSSKRQFLLQNGNQVNIEQDMVCTDQTIPTIKPVEIGDRIRESQVVPHPNFLKRFEYRAAQCRWFIEAEAISRDLVQRQGIICQIRDSDWQVVDKW